MLVNVFKRSDIVVMKLATGEEIVASYVEEKPNGNIVVKNPIRCMLAPQQDGTVGVSYLPFVVGIDPDNNHEINVTNILVMPCHANDSIKKVHTENFPSLTLV